ncbi:hypothetical protein [Granulicella mallensis]|uniref:Uncharacterized protein n=1 Tax=Granulicella mallensis TaxID=940614 RepID=A0A7W8EBM1_9BACT|nr:hypothetical protein [Granulicella mallensis]MBB5065972.1 hypothetical protein [Granulicella mallensis]
MEPSNILKKLGRLLWLFVIANVSIFLLSVVGSVIWANISTVQAVGWHLLHGNKVAFDGHTFHVPLLWNCTPDGRHKGLELSEEHELLGGQSSIQMKSTGKVLDAPDVYRLRAEGIATLNRMKSPDTYSSEIIHGKQLEFVCVRDDMGSLGETLFCKVSNTDISVTVSASKKYRIQARSILESSD